MQTASIDSKERQDGRVLPCWSCKGPVATGALFCGVCEAVQPPGQADPFSRLGFEALFDVDTAELDRRYFNLAVF